MGAIADELLELTVSVYLVVCHAMRYDALAEEQLRSSTREGREGMEEYVPLADYSQSKPSSRKQYDQLHTPCNPSSNASSIHLPPFALPHPLLQPTGQRRTHTSLRMIQLNPPRKPPLRQQSQLRNNEFIELHNTTQYAVSQVSPLLSPLLGLFPAPPLPIRFHFT